MRLLKDHLGICVKPDGDKDEQETFEIEFGDPICKVEIEKRNSSFEYIRGYMVGVVGLSQASRASKG